MIEKSLLADGFSSDAVARCIAELVSPRIARTGDRSSRAFLVKAISSAHFAMGRWLQSDTDALQNAARRMLSHGPYGPTINPVGAMGYLSILRTSTDFRSLNSRSSTARDGQSFCDGE
jgi:hypothetical protein